MPPVNPSSTSSEVDNEATAELPVLDVAAYESTLNEPVSHTDTWVLPTGVAPQVVDAKALTPDSIPTLSPVDLEGTTEIPHKLDFSRHARNARPAAVPQERQDFAPGESGSEAGSPGGSSRRSRAGPGRRCTARAADAHGHQRFVRDPAVAAADRGAAQRARERGAAHPGADRAPRIADAERNVAVDRANAEAAQLREQLGLQFEKLSSRRASASPCSAGTSPGCRTSCSAAMTSSTSCS